MHPIPPALIELLQCPLCASPLQSLTCSNCATEFVNFDGLLSFMPAGIWQRNLWQHQLALNHQQAQMGIELMQAQLERSDLVPATLDRIREALAIAEQSLASIEGLMARYGLQPEYQEQFQHLSLGPISEYYHHILQDWAWGDEAIKQRLAPILAIAPPEPIGTLVALGAGAGRLSWELHQRLRPAQTLACDINPLLLAAGHSLIKKQQGFDFFELNSFPQIGLARSACFSLPAARNAEGNNHNWHALAADVWHMPLKEHSADVILTAWFIDVHGGDNRQLIRQIYQWLKPGGLWINSGPLLYPKNTPLEHKYDRQELLQLISLAGFSWQAERLDSQVHLSSPINVRQQTEQAWTFCARKPTSPNPPPTDLPPAWLIYHQLPVPGCFTPQSDSHPLIERIVQAVDGTRSIEQLTALTAELFPDGLDPHSTLVEILGELFRASADEG